MTVLTTSKQGEKGPIPLESFPVLRKLGERDLAALHAAVVSNWYDKGESILPIEEEKSTIIAIRKGSVHLYLASSDGREMTLQYRRTGSLAGLPDGGSPGAIPATAEAAVGQTALFLIPGNVFWTMTMAQPDAMNELVPLVWGRLQSEERLLYNLFAFTISARLAHVPVELAEESPDGIVRSPQAELAIMVGATREEVTKILRDFRVRGWIEHEPHSHEIVLYDLERLIHEGDLG